MLTILRSIVIALLVFVAGPALAQPADFRTTYERGMTHFHAKDFAQARQEFLAAYAIQAEPTVLFAIAQTYRFEGNFKEAIAWYQKFLGDSKAAHDLRVEAQTYLDESEARQKEIDQAERDAASHGPKEADGTPATMPQATTTIPKSAPTIIPASAPAAPTDVVRTRRIPLGSKIGAGVTGAGLITTIVITKVGRGIEQDFVNDRAMHTATQAEADRVDRYQNMINISWGVTAAAGIATVAFYFVTPSYTAQQTQVVVTPNAGGGLSAGLAGRF
jgi:hypothetical protein